MYNNQTIMESNENAVCQSCPSRVFPSGGFTRGRLEQGERTKLDPTFSYRVDVESGLPRCIHPDRLKADTVEDFDPTFLYNFNGDAEDIDAITQWVRDNIRKMSPLSGLSVVLDGLHDRFVAVGGDETLLVGVLRNVLSGE